MTNNQLDDILTLLDGLWPKANLTPQQIQEFSDMAIKKDYELVQQAMRRHYHWQGRKAADKGRNPPKQPNLTTIIDKSHKPIPKPEPAEPIVSASKEDKLRIEEEIMAKPDGDPQKEFLKKVIRNRPGSHPSKKLLNKTEFERKYNLDDDIPF